jgi:membrane protein
VRSTGRFSRVRDWVRDGTAVARRAQAWAAALVARVPVLGRLVSELVRVEVIDRALAIGAQALLAVLPLLVVVAAFAPPSLGADVLAQIRDAMGIPADLAEPLQQLVLPEDQVRQEVGWVGLLITLISGTSFSRALQRAYAKVWDLTGVRRSGAVRSSVLWLVGLLVYFDVVVLIERVFEGTSMDLLPPVLVLAALQLAMWWWSARVLLLWRVPWSGLLPSAVLTVVGMLLLMAGSDLVMPRYATVSVEQFGSFGLVLAAASWLVAFGFVVIVTAVLGRVAAEQPVWGRLVDWVARRRAAATTGPAPTTDGRRP